MCVFLTPLVVIPRDELDEVVVERETCLGIEYGRVLVMEEVRGHNFIRGVSEDTLERTFSSLLDGLADLLV